ncbi:hypothetical protein BDW02DRAFT_568720 [Decorospora gaudefroyi]|uniref:Mid2 domain-containing protein n=1 Tax=Decorospora gaudefroyi TaxID=184978 RepID=A0A6A5KK49_9PLEO|nr:hypothetical protein BDW02DRAFT_568720 [Decorospora gaudefroyi]
MALRTYISALLFIAATTTAQSFTTLPTKLPSIHTLSSTTLSTNSSQDITSLFSSTTTIPTSPSVTTSSLSTTFLETGTAVRPTLSAAPPTQPKPSSPLQPSPGPDSGSGITGFTVGTAVGGAAGGLVILSILIFWLRARKRRRARIASRQNDAAAAEKLLSKNSKDDVSTLVGVPVDVGTSIRSKARKVDEDRRTNTL